MAIRPKKHTSVSDRRFNLDDTPQTSPWRSYNIFNKYDESYPITAYEMFTTGKTMSQVARSLKCSMPTLKRWMREIEDFGEACELGITNAQADMEDKLQAVMIADGTDDALPETNTKLLETYIKSQFPETYSEKYQSKEVEETSDGAAALFDLLQQTDRLSVTATKDGQTISIEKNNDSDKKEPILINQD